MKDKKEKNILEEIYDTIPVWKNKQYDTQVAIANTLILNMKNRKKSKEEFAKELGISVSKLNKYLSGTYDFKIGEILKLDPIVKMRITIE